MLIPHFINTAYGLLARAWGDSLPYLYQALLGVVAFFALLKDWSDYGNLSKKWGRAVPLILAIITAVITLLSIRETSSSRAEQASNRATIAQLSTQIDQLRGDNQKSADGFRDSFATLYQRFTDLQSKVQNADLLKEIDATKKELVATQSKLTPLKISPIATFPSKDPSKIPITEFTTARSGDFVEVKFTVYNPSDSNAGAGAIILRICESCRYADEPPGFHKITGSAESDREKDFQHIWAKAGMEIKTARIVVPPQLDSFMIGVIVACENCVAPEQQRLTVNLQ